MRGWARNTVDVPARRYWNQGAEESEYAGAQARAAEMLGRLQMQDPDYGSVAASIADKMGGRPEDYLEFIQQPYRVDSTGMRAPLGGEAAQAALDAQLLSAGMSGVNKNPLSMHHFQRLMGGTDTASRATQGVVYGVPALAALTATGQGLLALTDYISKSLQTEQEREQPLSS
tara:strand:+ start:4376 stop:4894 length:519 start_codon:yes stop_codon:yes gene_type:complete